MPTFNELMTSLTAVPKYELWIDGTEYTSYVVQWGTISRRADTVTVSSVSVTLDNVSKSFNVFFTDPDNWFGRSIDPVQIYIKFDELPAEKSLLFTGYIDDARFADTQVTITMRDRLVTMFPDTTERATPLPFVVTNQNPADVVWTLLTDATYGVNLSTVTATTNTDIDYQAWVDWKDTLENVLATTYDYRINVNIDDVDVGSLISKILDMTFSVCFMSKDNKLVIRSKIYYMSVGQSGAITDTEKEDILPVTVSASEVENDLAIFYGYSSVTPSVWPSAITTGDPTSQTAYGVKSKVEKDESVFLTDVNSAYAYEETYSNLLLRFARRRVKINTYLNGFLIDLYQGYNLYDDFYDFATVQFVVVEELSYDLDNFKTEVAGFLRLT